MFSGCPFVHTSVRPARSRARDIGRNNLRGISSWHESPGRLKQEDKILVIPSKYSLHIL